MSTSEATRAVGWCHDVTPALRPEDLLADAEQYEAIAARLAAERGEDDVLGYADAMRCAARGLRDRAATLDRSPRLW